MTAALRQLSLGEDACTNGRTYAAPCLADLHSSTSHAVMFFKNQTVDGTSCSDGRDARTAYVPFINGHMMHRADGAQSHRTRGLTQKVTFDMPPGPTK